jgi:hypothetical protein
MAAAQRREFSKGGLFLTEEVRQDFGILQDLRDYPANPVKSCNPV